MLNNSGLTTIEVLGKVPGKVGVMRFVTLSTKGSLITEAMEDEHSEKSQEGPDIFLCDSEIKEI
jgi:hypothetical protein